MTSIRNQKKLSYVEFGKLEGTSGDIIGKHERNEINPSIESAAKIADTLGITIDYLEKEDYQIIDKETLISM